MWRPSAGTKRPENDAPSGRSTIVVAGPSSSLTIPGITVSQIVRVLAQMDPVIRIQINQDADFDSGLFRAPSLAAAHDDTHSWDIVTYEVPPGGRPRASSFRQWMGEDVLTAVAFVWPGIDNNWIRPYFQAARSVGATTAVVCVSLPRTSGGALSMAADAMMSADWVFVGDEADADKLRLTLGPRGPQVESNTALSLRGRSDGAATQLITAFLPRDSTRSLSSLLTAFDAIPEAWIEKYRLQVVMRHRDDAVPKAIERSHHNRFTTLISDDLSSEELGKICESSSALIIADPAVDSRAYSFAVEHGVATVVLASAELPVVGSGYVGALLADENHPVSVHVALTHALRLAELQFPRPDAWRGLADRLIESARRPHEETEDLEAATRVR